MLDQQLNDMFDLAPEINTLEAKLNTLRDAAIIRGYYVSPDDAELVKLYDTMWQLRKAINSLREKAPKIRYEDK